MGRKAVSKERKDDIDKKLVWSKALFQHLQDNGLQRLSINKIAKYLNVSKSTFYEYFNSKEAIIQLAVSQKIDQVSPGLEILARQGNSFEARYWEFFKHITETCKEISSVFLYDLRKYYPHEWNNVTAFLDILMQSMTTFYVDGMEAGAFRKGCVPLIVEQDRHFIFSIMTNKEFFLQNDLCLDQVIRDYLQFKFYGLAS